MINNEWFYLQKWRHERRRREQLQNKEQRMYHTKETNVYICNNIPVDAPIYEMQKIREARGSLEAMVALGKYPPGEYIIHRKGLPAADRQAGPNGYTYGMTFQAAVRETARAKATNKYNYGGNLDRAKLWVTRFDKKKIFISHAGKPHKCVALSTATFGLYES